MCIRWRRLWISSCPPPLMVKKKGIKGGNFQIKKREKLAKNGFPPLPISNHIFNANDFNEKNKPWFCQIVHVRGSHGNCCSLNSLFNCGFIITSRPVYFTAINSDNSTYLSIFIVQTCTLENWGTKNTGENIHNYRNWWFIHAKRNDMWLFLDMTNINETARPYIISM